MLGVPFSAVNEAVLLVALSSGYIVLYLANKEKKGIKTTGYFIGVFIIALSSILILVNIFLNARICSKFGTLMPGHRMMKGGQFMQPVPGPMQK